MAALGGPEEVKVYDFIDKDLGKAIPYGVYDMTADTGWVSVGVDHDTAEFAVETIRRWWERWAAGCIRRRRSCWSRPTAAVERQPVPPVEDGATAAGRRDEAEDLGVPLPAGHQQVEQD